MNSIEFSWDRVDDDVVVRASSSNIEYNEFDAAEDDGDRGIGAAPVDVVIKLGVEFDVGLYFGIK
jgi:hypothetical protein